MTRFAPLAAACVTAVAILSVPVQAKDQSQRSDWFEPYEVTYLEVYEEAHKAGFDVGANLVDDDLAGEAEVRESTARLEGWLRPAPASDTDATVAAPPEPTSSYGSSGTSWDAVAACESGGNWSINTGNGYYGGLQFDSQTWDAYGDPSYGEASDAPMEAQIAAAESMPYDGWPNC